MSSAPKWAVEGRDWPNRASSRFVESGRLRWHVQVMGPAIGEAPVLLLLHGTGAGTHSWRALAPLLAEHFTVVAPDLPGHAFTSGRPLGGLSMRAMARAVSALMATMELAPDMIVGHSAGSAVAIRMAIDDDAKPTAVVALNAALLPFPGLAALLFPTLARMLFVNPFAPHLFAAMARNGETAKFLQRSTGSTIDREGIDCYQRLFQSPGHCSGAITMMADWDLASLEQDLPRVAVPLLMIHGDRDAAIPIANARDAAGRMPGATLTDLPGLGHLAHEENPDAVAELIRDFARRSGVGG